VKNRALLLGGVIAAAVVVVVVAIVVSQGGADEDDKAQAPVSQGSGTEPAQSADFLEGVPQNGITLGDPDAPVTMIEFVDLQCPFCAEYATGAFPAVVEEYVSTGRLKVEQRVLAFLGPDSGTAATFAAATAQQNKQFGFTELFFANQGEENSGYVTEDFLRGLAEQVPGLDVEKAFADAGTPAAQDAVQEAGTRADDLGVEGTPSFYLQRGDGEPEPFEVSALDADGFTSELDAALQQ
jgi:protein-disulfide isomerase